MRAMQSRNHTSKKYTMMIFLACFVINLYLTGLTSSQRYTKMTACIFPLQEVKNLDEISGGILEKWPMRLNASPPRLRKENDKGLTLQRMYSEDNRIWKKRVSNYEVMLKSFSSGRYRNVMDMNSGFGGFAAAMVKHPVWVMNVVPFDAKSDYLGVIYQRGLIGTYMDWFGIIRWSQLQKEFSLFCFLEF